MPYTAPLISFATLYCAITTAIVIILPYALCFSVSRFWVYESAIYATPTIAYSNDLLVEYISNGRPYTTATSIKTTATQVPVSIKYSKSVSASNTDQIQLGIEFPCPAAAITDLRVAIGLKYILSTNIMLQLNSPLIFSFSSSSIGGAVINGDVSLKQKNPLSGSDLVRVDYNESLFMKDISQMQEDNALRNESLVFSGVQSVLPVCAGGVRIDVLLAGVLVEGVRYVPSVMEALKMKWLEYLSILYPLYAILMGIMGVVLKGKVLRRSAQYEQ